MDKLEYIPGDLVMTNGVPLGTAKDVVYRVVSSDPSKTLKLEDGTVLKGVVCLENIECAEFGDKGFLSGDCCAWVKHIVPIQITKEILEKNGWFEDSFLDDYKSFYKNDRNYPSLHGQQTKDGYIYDVDFGEETIITNIKYVHQLQHLLFGLGLPMNLKV